MLQSFHQTKKGVASLYAVIFATILFGVITLSFIRIVLSEARQSSDDELSQSAYDSALAGIEDTKRAVNAYYTCLNAGGTASSCGNLFVNTDSCEKFNEGTSNLKKKMGFENTIGEVKVQEQNTTSGTTTETSTDQAYTCIILSDETDDYRSTLTSDTRVRVVPLAINNGTGSNLDSVKTIEFKWFSENNGTNILSDASYNLYTDRALRKAANTSKIPVISLTLLYTESTFKISDFNNSTSEKYSTMILLPGTGANATDNNISWTKVGEAGNSDKSNAPFLINCTQDTYACQVSITGAAMPSGGNALLIVSMPYGGTISDFSVALKNASGNIIPFKGAQISVDSTGRANQLYRRVEARLDPVDNYFPYPQFA